MSRFPIGVFDSGLGGLTAVRQLRRLMPSESIIYFGDTARVPYGNRSRDTLMKYARQDLRFLRTFQPKAVLIACGTVSTNCLHPLRSENDIPIVGVVEPAVRRAIAATRSGKVGLIATRASVASGAYQDLFSQLAPHILVSSVACPLLVPLVEEGRFRPGDPVSETVVAEYLTPLRQQGVDTLVLGCTHYPLLSSIIQRFMGDDVTLVDVGAEAALSVRSLLSSRHQLAACPQGDTSFFVSDRAEDFQRLASIFLGDAIPCSTKQIDISQY